MMTGDLNDLSIAKMTGDQIDKPLLRRMLQRPSDWHDTGMEKIHSMDDLAIVTIVSSVVCLLVMVCLMKTVFTLDQPPQRQRPDQWRQPSRPTSPYQRPVVNMFPVNGTNFEEMIVRTKPGVRTVLIMVNQEVKNKLIKQFADTMLPFSRSSAFQFAYLQLEDDLPWYVTLLQKALSDCRDFGAINPQNCLGTVLAINGPRKYFSLYHAYAEMNIAKSTSGGNANNKQQGEFMGFEDSDDSENEAESQMLFEADLLGRLGSWMEKLCEGSIPRIRVDAWPPMR